MGQKNFISLTRFPLIYRHYAFVDVDDHLADSLFIRHKVRVWFGKEYANPEKEYQIIFCKIRKQDEDRFVAALGELSNKMILFGHPDYDEFCQKALDIWESRDPDKKKKRSKKQKSEGAAVNAAEVI